MRATIFFAVLIAISASIFGQVPQQDPEVLKDEYLAKRKSLNTAGTVLEVGALIGFSVAIGTDLKNFSYLANPADYEPTPNMTWLYITSLAMAVGGVVCYVSATKYKMKARSISFQFKMNKTEFLQKGLVYSKPIPSLAITLSIAKGKSAR
jgi:hypothetical protein